VANLNGQVVVGGGGEVEALALSNTAQVTGGSLNVTNATGNQVSVSVAQLSGVTNPIIISSNDGTGGTNTFLWSLVPPATYPTLNASATSGNASAVTLSSAIVNPSTAAITGSGALPVAIVTNTQATANVTAFAITSAATTLSNTGLSNGTADSISPVTPNNIGVTSTFQ
jgi:hypothetical protein